MPNSSSKQVQRKIKKTLSTPAWRLSRWALYLTIITIAMTVMTLGIAALTVIPFTVPIIVLLLMASGLLSFIRFLLQ